MTSGATIVQRSAITPPETPRNWIHTPLTSERNHHKALPPIPVHSAEIPSLDDRGILADSEKASAKSQRFREFLDEEMLQLKQRVVTEFDMHMCDWRDFLISTAKQSRNSRRSVHVAPSKEVVLVTSNSSLLDDNQDDEDAPVESRTTVGSKSTSTLTVREMAFYYSLTLPAARWRKLVVEITRPTARVSRPYKHYVNECWVHYLGMLRHNKRDSVNSLDSAKEKIATSQRRMQPILTYNASLITGSPDFTMGSIIHPHTCTRHVWVWCSLCLILCDSIAVPFAAFFDPDHSSDLLGFVLWFTLGFWFLDILVTFRTGREVEGAVEMRPAKIATMYAKSWLLFDAGLLALSILATFLDRIMVSSAGEGTRILHLTRLLRLAKLQTVSEELLSVNVTRKRVIRYSSLMKFLLLCTIYFHTLTCVWYGIGQVDDVGWVSACLTQSSSQAYCYFVAAHWVFSWLCGTVGETYNTSLELAVATVASYIGVMCFALLLGMVINTMASRRNSSGLDTTEMRIRCAAYSKNHNLSQGLSRRLLRFILSCDIHQEDLSQHLRQETEMLQNLPLSLQIEVLQEARRPHLETISIMRDLLHVSPVMATRLCSETVTSVICLCGEFVFTSGDTGTHWRVVENGSLIYTLKAEKDITRADSPAKGLGGLRKASSISWDSLINSSTTMGAQTATAGMSISEMVLWTSWEHAGDLLASTDCVLLWLGLDAFSHLLKGRTDACLVAATYAHAYVRRINEAQGLVSDLYTHIGTAQDLEADLHGSLEHEVGHYRVFLSHYKAEAGTEATLMQESLQKLIAKEMATNTDNPVKDHDEKPYVFLDSEDLIDLSTLTEMVCRSDNLVLLLTPNVLMRPWCLVEIATAMANGVTIVPVEIQRPGLRYKYPDNEFYARLRRPKSLGGLLLDEDLAMLEKEGIAMDSIEESIRFVFTQIALPFSPHKSKAIREAELADIVKRCIRSYRSGSSKPTISQHAKSFVLQSFGIKQYASTKHSRSDWSKFSPKESDSSKITAKSSEPKGRDISMMTSESSSRAIGGLEHE